MKLHLASNLSLPVDTVTQSLAILARKRAGKSYLARRFAEQLLASDQQVVIVDPKGDWWGIRSSADGKSPGFPVVVLGGEHGDLPLEKTAAETVARLIVEERVSVLLDLSEFRKSEIALFLGGDIRQHRDGLLEIIYRLKAKEEFRTPVMVIVDEADAIAPQRPYPGEERMLGAMSDIVRRGGQRGIGSMLITQRSSVINKDVLTQSQVMIALRTIAKLDLNAIMDWVDVHGVPEQGKVLKASLPSLPTGDAWMLSPGWPTDAGIFERIHGLPINTFDSGATPKPGEKRIKPRNLADVDLPALQRRMAETIERVKADDPKILRQEIAKLKAELAKKPGPSGTGVPVKVDPAAVERAVAAAIAKTAGAAQKEMARILKPIRDAMQTAVGLLGRAAREIEAALPPESVTLKVSVDLPQPDHISRSVNMVPPPHQPHQNRRPPVTRDPKPAGDGPPESLSKMQRTMLTALAQHPEGLTKAQLLLHADYSANGSTSRTFAEFARFGWAMASQGKVVITAEGLASLGEYEPLPVGDDLRRHLLTSPKLSTMEKALLGQLCERYPDSVPKGLLLQLARYSANGSTSRAFARLVRFGYVTGSGSGMLRAADVLFLEGQ